MQIALKDRDILRDLAKKVAEIGNLPIQKERAEMWTHHNDLNPVRPMVLIFPEGSWREMLPDSDLTASPDCPLHGLERDLRLRLYYHQHLPDDNVIEPVIVSPLVIRTTGWGLGLDTTEPDEDTGARHYNAVIRTETDIDSLTPPQVTIDWEQSRTDFEELQEMFGDVITVEQRGCANCGRAPMDQYAQWRGLEDLYMDLVDRPEWVHRAMTILVDGALAELELLEREGALSLNNRNHYTGSGGVGYTRQLPQSDFDGEHVRLKDMWGFATPQMFSEVSPAMHEEFALRHEKRLLERFGLNAYGCCEPLHNKLEIVKTIPNLRRVSISPFAEVVKSAEGLGGDYVYSWKPNPAMVAGEEWDPDYVRRVTQDFLEKTRGCVVEMVMKDTHTCRHEPHRMWEWTRIARECAEQFAA